MTVFCPNCGKPNTDQAVNCAACGNELATNRQGAKFKGTIMMTEVMKPETSGAAPEPQESAAKAPSRRDPSSGGDMAFQATMMGTPASAPARLERGPSGNLASETAAPHQEPSTPQPSFSGSSGVIPAISPPEATATPSRAAHSTPATHSMPGNGAPAISAPLSPPMRASQSQTRATTPFQGAGEKPNVLLWIGFGAAGLLILVGASGWFASLLAARALRAEVRELVQMEMASGQSAPTSCQKLQTCCGELKELPELGMWSRVCDQKPPENDLACAETMRALEQGLTLSGRSNVPASCK